MGMLVDGKWSDQDRITSSDGRFVRPESPYRDWITADGSSGFKAEADRYHLYVTHNCPWAYRTTVFRKIKGLEDVIGLSIAGSSAKTEGWTFTKEEGTTEDHLFDSDYMHQVYTQADGDFTGRVTVPTLWDKKKGTIVNNESSEIIRMLNSAFGDITGDNTDFYPEDLRADIDAINDIVYPNVNNGVYRCGFAKSQEAYEEAYDALFSTLDELEALLGKQRYLVGGRLTEADWRLFSTLLRFDIVYYGHFKCNRQHIYEYPNLWNFTLELYQYPGVAEVTSIEHIKRGYYISPDRNPSGVVPKGPVLNYDAPHDRDRFSI
ncbi:MAG: glutathione S-transferase family protein [Proteobacteria bacterium]|nr:glutathione S-transferase family protein [Pseudomonadota bacterium]